MENKWFKLFPDATKNKVEFLIDGKETFESIVKAIETAENQDHYIYILGWMLDIDFTLISRDFFCPNTLFELLCSAAEKGVEVRILVWDNPLYFREIRDAIQKLNKIPNVKAFRDGYTYSTPPQLKKFIAQLVPFVESRLREYARYLVRLNKQDLDYVYLMLEHCSKKNVGSHHEKILIVNGKDGLIAFCGGLDINRNRFDEFHDTHCKVQGPAAYQILEKFRKRWNNHLEAKKFSLKGENTPEPSKVSTDECQYVKCQYVKVVGTYNDPHSNDRDRSLKETYLKIIDNAEKYIYVEDQYMVNKDVAEHLNKKIRDPNFKLLIMLTQDSKLTREILIPDRKRGEFMDALLYGTNQQEKDKVDLLLIDEANAKKAIYKKAIYKKVYHPGIHAKTLIVDDEIAIIGSANVTRRSFTHDSETSVIVFEARPEEKNTFAKRLRVSTWTEYATIKGRMPSHTYVEEWERFSHLVTKSTFSILIKYINSGEDLDKQIIDIIKKMGVIAPVVASYVLDEKIKYINSGEDLDKQIIDIHHDLAESLSNVSIALNRFNIEQLFDLLWDNIIDPEVK